MAEGKVALLRRRAPRADRRAPREQCAGLEGGAPRDGAPRGPRWRPSQTTEESAWQRSCRTTACTCWSPLRVAHK